MICDRETDRQREKNLTVTFRGYGVACERCACFQLISFIEFSVTCIKHF